MRATRPRPARRPRRFDAPASRSPRLVQQQASHLCFLPAFLTRRASGFSRCSCVGAADCPATGEAWPALTLPFELASLLSSCGATSRSAPGLAALQLSYSDFRACTRHGADRVWACWQPGWRGSSSSGDTLSPANWLPHRFTRVRSIRCESSFSPTLRARPSAIHVLTVRRR